MPLVLGLVAGVAAYPVHPLLAGFARYPSQHEFLLSLAGRKKTPDQKNGLKFAWQFADDIIYPGNGLHE